MTEPMAMSSRYAPLNAAKRSNYGDLATRPVGRGLLLGPEPMEIPSRAPPYFEDTKCSTVLGGTLVQFCDLWLTTTLSRSGPISPQPATVSTIFTGMTIGSPTIALATVEFEDCTLLQTRSHATGQRSNSSSKAPTGCIPTCRGDGVSSVLLLG